MNEPLRNIEHLQELFYGGTWNIHELMARLEERIESSREDPVVLLECLYITKILREDEDPHVAGYLRDFIERHIDFWPETAGLILIVELLDIIVSFKRADDIDFLIGLLPWDLYQVPSHIIMLTRRHGWIELWRRIQDTGDISSEYDEYIRAQYFRTNDLIDASADRILAALPSDLRRELKRLYATKRG